MKTYTLLTGRKVRLSTWKRPEVDAFLERLRSMIASEHITEQQMIGLAYSTENPILDSTFFPTRALVTKDTLADPAYQVLTDLLARKHLAQRGIDPDALAAEYTLSVADASKMLGIHESAVRQAIAARRIPSWVKGNGRLFLSPRSVEAFRIAPRGPMPVDNRREVALSCELEVCFGNERGWSFRLDHDGEYVSSDPSKAVDLLESNAKPQCAGGIRAWKNVWLISSHEDSQRYWHLVPNNAAPFSEVVAGSFYARGKFTIAAQSNNSRTARAHWKARHAPGKKDST